ncbi:MAG: nucleotidyltransferase family protein [Verrucomicrobiae bacterium]|nr:nucleotidyltransferase family protein [Verrucomicrobiae bacterium]
MNLTDSEGEILLETARQEMAAAAVQRVRALLESGVRWELLGAAAWRHGVASLLYRHLAKEELRGLVPQPMLHNLRQCYVRAAFRNRFHIDQLAMALDALAAGGVDAIVMKGAHLAPLLYGDPALRPFADIDLLVRAGDVARALGLLGKAGYDLSPGLLSAGLNRRYHVNLPLIKRGDRPVHVELHWSLTDRFSNHAADHDAIWGRSAEAEIGGARARVLSAEDLLIYLALHLDKHGYLNRGILGSGRERGAALDEMSANRLIWFTDLHELCERHGRSMDWGAVVGRSRAGGMGVPVGTSLALLMALLGSRVDRATLGALVPSGAAWFRRWLALSLSGGGGDGRARGRVRDFMRRMMLPTRKDFELRLVRLLDLGEFLFPGPGARPAGADWGAGRALAHAIRGAAMCGGLIAGAFGCHAKARIRQILCLGGRDGG